MTSCNVQSSAYGNRPLHVRLPNADLILKEPFRHSVAMEVPRSSKVRRYASEGLARGEAGSIDGNGIEERPVFLWEMRLYDSAAEQEYQSAAWRKNFKGKGPERTIRRTEQVVRFDLPEELWNYPGGAQSMFRYDKKNEEGTLVVRIAVYSLDEFLGSEESIQACHKQIEDMLKSIRFIR